MHRILNIQSYLTPLYAIVRNPPPPPPFTLPYLCWKEYCSVLYTQEKPLPLLKVCRKSEVEVMVNVSVNVKYHVLLVLSTHLVSLLFLRRRAGAVFSTYGVKARPEEDAIYT